MICHVTISDANIILRMCSELCLYWWQELLGDMGIKKIGDVLSILRHSKAVHAEVSVSYILRKMSNMNRH